MTIDEAYNFLESLIVKTNKKSEIKNYEEFLQILINLKNRGLSDNEIQSIEKELDKLKSNSIPKNKNKHFKKALLEFKKYLKENFSFISKGYYTNLGANLGASFGAMFGLVFLGYLERSLGMVYGFFIGAVLGILIGRYMDAKALTEDRVL